MNVILNDMDAKMENANDEHRVERIGATRLSEFDVLNSVVHAKMRLETSHQSNSLMGLVKRCDKWR